MTTDASSENDMRKPTDVAENDRTTTQTRIIRAVYTDTTVRVYQAYNDEIADAVLEAQSFQPAMDRGLWSSKRMTWIKPSKVWMAYRCGWTTLKDANQARVLALDLDRSKFDELLAKGTLTHHGKSSEGEFRNQSVVVQWDPERVINLKATPQQVFTRSTPDVRSIQIGLRPPANECLLDPQTVIRITDVTQDFRSALQAIESGCSLSEIEALLWPEGQLEKVMPVASHIEANLAMTNSSRPGESRTSNTPQRPQAIVVLGCTANPPHHGHLHCIAAAEAHSEKALGYDVLFSTIAVSPLGYVKSKAKKHNCPLVFDDEARLSILKLTAADFAENTHEHFRFEVPTRTFGSALECGRALRPSPDVTVIVVVGGDRFKWSKPSHPDLVTLCCARNDEQYGQLKERLEHDSQAGLVSGDPTRWQLLSAVGPATSSTLVRSILLDEDSSEPQKRTLLKENGYTDKAVDVLLKGSGQCGG